MSKFKTLQILVRDNGVRWTCNYLLHRFFRFGYFNRRMEFLEELYKIPGANCRRRNLEMWENYDWNTEGEEWTVSREWKRSLIKNVMFKYIDPGHTVLEIGPGAGRWSVELQKIAKELMLVDISSRVISICRDRLRSCPNVQAILGDGRSLSFLKDESIDYVWSFDVFVHVSVPDTEMYIAELSRVLRPGGRGIIHHPKEGQKAAAFRSRMTSEKFLQLLGQYELTCLEQLDAWGEDDEFTVRSSRDDITIFEKPTDSGAVASCNPNVERSNHPSLPV
jgi:ubiquinone/menaquinone biosynthesis C-methylase UbiE